MRAVQIFFGLVVILFGLFLLLITMGMLALNTIDVAGIALMLSGLLFWIPGIAWRRKAAWLAFLFIPGALAFAIGAILMYTGRTNWNEWSYLWTMLLIAIGFAFLAIYYLALPAHWVWLVGAVIGGIGALLLALFLSLFGADGAARIVGPIVLIALGGLLALGALVPRRV
jgi:hypothetical protein